MFCPLYDSTRVGFRPAAGSQRLRGACDSAHAPEWRLLTQSHSAQQRAGAAVTSAMLTDVAESMCLVKTCRFDSRQRKKQALRHRQNKLYHSWKPGPKLNNFSVRHKHRKLIASISRTLISFIIPLEGSVHSDLTPGRDIGINNITMSLP